MLSLRGNGNRNEIVWRLPIAQLAKELANTYGIPYQAPLNLARACVCVPGRAAAPAPAVPALDFVGCILDEAKGENQPPH